MVQLNSKLRVRRQCWNFHSFLFSVLEFFIYICRFKFVPAGEVDVHRAVEYRNRQIAKVVSWQKNEAWYGSANLWKGTAEGIDYEGSRVKVNRFIGTLQIAIIISGFRFHCFVLEWHSLRRPMITLKDETIFRQISKRGRRRAILVLWQEIVDYFRFLILQYNFQLSSKILKNGRLSPPPD